MKCFIDSAWKSQFLSGMMMPIMAFVGNLGYAGVAIAGGFLAIQGKQSRLVISRHLSNM